MFAPGTEPRAGSRHPIAKLIGGLRTPHFGRLALVSGPPSGVGQVQPGCAGAHRARLSNVLDGAPPRDRGGWAGS